LKYIHLEQTDTSSYFQLHARGVQWQASEGVEYLYSLLRYRRSRNFSQSPWRLCGGTESVSVVPCSFGRLCVKVINTSVTVHWVLLKLTELPYNFSTISHVSISFLLHALYFPCTNRFSVLSR